MTQAEFMKLYDERVGISSDVDKSKKAEAFFDLYRILTEYNEKFNLTAIKTPEDYLSKHISDCVALSDYVSSLISENGTDTILDVGSGAGFPAIPLAVMLDNAQVFALDSTAKKLTYIKEAAKRLNLYNISCITARAEELAIDNEYRERFSVVTARAVARLNVLIELCAPFVKVGGYFVAMKASAAAEEAAEAKKAAKILGMSEEKLIPYSLPCMSDLRAFVVYRKISPTPDRYPRQYSKIVKNPL